jgi:hypothetical protein
MEEKKMKRVKRLLAILLSALMICSTMIIPSFAEGETGGPTQETSESADETQPAGEGGEENKGEGGQSGQADDNTGKFYDASGLSKIAATKILDVPTVGTIPDMSFYFKLTGATANGEEDSEGNSVQDGVGTVYARVDYSASDADNAVVVEKETSRSTITKEAEFDITQLLALTTTVGEGEDAKTVDALEAGKVYVYTMTEVADPTTLNLKTDDALFKDAKSTKQASMVSYADVSYRIYLYVAKNSDGQRVINTVIAKNSQGKKSEVNFENTLNAYDLVITKRVAGNYVNSNDSFTFAIKVPVGGIALNLEKDYPLDAYKVDANGNKTKTTITVGGEQEDDTGWNVFTLKADESLMIAGVPKGMIYYVKETDALGYFPSYAWLTGDNTESESTTFTSKSDPEQYFTIGAGNNIVLFKNTRNQPDTGIRLDVVPYVIVFAGAALGAVMLVCKKRKSTH